MNRKEKLRQRIDDVGIVELSSAMGLSVIELLRYSEYPVNSNKIVHLIIDEILEGINTRPGGEIYYKEYRIYYDRFEGLLVWDNGAFVENRGGGGVSYEFYATPYYDGGPTVPITLSSVWIGNVDSGEPMNISDEIYAIDDYFTSYKVDDSGFKTVDDVENWFKHSYLPKTYLEIRKLSDRVVEENKL